MNLSLTFQRINHWLQNGHQPAWLKLTAIVGAIVGALYVLTQFWWAFALVALGYLIGISRR